MSEVALLIIGITSLFFILVIAGHMKGPPKPESMSIEALLGRIQSEEAWIRKYKSLPFSNQQGSGIKKQYEGKKIHVMGLQLEVMKRGLIAQGKNLNQTMIPILRRKIDLMKAGVTEDDAMNQASNEFILARDAAAEVSETTEKKS